MTSVSVPRGDPAPLFDQVTGFPPEDAVDLAIPAPLSLAVHMTVLESTGRGAQLATLRKLHIDEAREAVRDLQARIGDLTGSPDSASARLRITHIVEQRVPAVNGLRPHIHAYIGTTVRPAPGGHAARVDMAALEALCEQDLFPAHRDRLVATTTERLGLRWGETPWSPCEVVEPPWLADRSAARRHEDLSCPGPWPRRQIRVGGYR